MQAMSRRAYSQRACNLYKIDKKYSVFSIGKWSTFLMESLFLDVFFAKIKLVSKITAKKHKKSNKCA